MSLQDGVAGNNLIAVGGLQMPHQSHILCVKGQWRGGKENGNLSPTNVIPTKFGFGWT